MIAAFTGHRPGKLGGYSPLNPARGRTLDAVTRFLTQYGVGRARIGMALGFDMWAAEACLLCSVPFVACIPFKGQELRWPPQSQQRFYQLLDTAADVVVVSGGGYSAAKMHVRNEFMVRNSNIVCALWDGTSGGTAGCVAFAAREEVPVVNIYSEVFG